jgi:SAM-dependent methyltransferase
MERLDLSPPDPKQAARIARYALARRICSGRRVLDVACGDGLGSSLLARWGAASVDGVDERGDAVARANELFASERVRFRPVALDRLDDHLAAESFDLAVALDASDHVRDPRALLRSLRRAVAPEGTIVVSWPNAPASPRRPTFEELRALGEETLGPAAAWLLGAHAAGYLNVAADSPLACAAATLLRTFDAREGGASLVPAEERIDGASCEWFAGAWGPGVEPSMLAGTMVYPVARTLTAENALLRELVSRQETELAKLGAALAAAEGLAEGIDGSSGRGWRATLEQVGAVLPRPARRVVSWAGAHARSTARWILSP